MADDPVPRLPPIGSSAGGHVTYKDGNASPAIAKRLLFSQASRFHLQADFDSPRTSRSSSPRTKTGGTFGKRSVRATASCSPLSTDRDISSLISPDIRRNRITKFKDLYKSQSAHTLDISKVVNKDIPTGLGEKSRSTPGLSPQDNRNFGFRREQNRSGYYQILNDSKSASPRLDSRRNKLLPTSTLTSASAVQKPETAPKSDSTQMDLMENNPNLISVQGRYNDHSPCDRRNGDQVMTEECLDSTTIDDEEMLMRQVYNKCTNWLQDVERVKGSHSLQLVMESPVTWHD